MMQRIANLLKRYRKNEDAATAVEFALVALPFLLMIFGVMEGGRVMWSMNGVQFAIEETSRYASINSTLTNESFESYAQGKLAEMYVASTPLIVTSSSVTTNGVNFIEIDGTYTHSTMLNGFLPANFGNFEFTTSARKPVIN